MAQRDGEVRLGGHRIRVTKLDKVLYPETGTTKEEVIAYYSAIAKTMIPHCRERPATRKRWPDGVGPDGSGAFFQKDLGDSYPDWVHTGEIQHKDHVNTYPLVDDAATLVWLAQLASLEIHVPQWRFTAEGKPGTPDRLVFDLDPGDGVDLTQLAQVAFLVRDLLRDMGLESIPVTSGSSGIHLYAALSGELSSDDASAVAHELARSLEADHPETITSSMKRALRPGKVFIDWSQNNAAKTTVAPYSLRGRTRPMVAAPRTWRELASPHLRHLEFHEVLQRVEKRGDPLAALLEAGAGKGAGAAPDRLTEYRAKRDAGRTPEPVPSPGDSDDDAEGDQRRFVIQRHQARRLHYDFRLEHDGVLVSWALPKGVPDDGAVNHLAVPTEDHPLSYRTFEGTIPRGEYGAGTVEIWDSGHYDLEKWRDDEVIVTLHGSPGGGLGGPRRVVLFRAGESGGKARWMIHRMELDGGARPTSPEVTTSGASDPADFTPMLAETAPLASLPHLDSGEWAFELKWDGIRALAVVEDGRLRLVSRSGHDLTGSYPELHGLPDLINAEQAVLDGELVALADDGIPSFSKLQQRFGLTEPDKVARARQAAPAAYFLFDVLQLNARDCRSLGYEQRRELLASLVEVPPDAPFAVPDAFDGNGEQALEAAGELGLEGVVAKRRDSVYRSGSRSQDWRKYPLLDTAEVYVMGWRESDAEPRGFASLLLAERRDGGLQYAGRVGTGFSTRQRREIRERLKERERAEPAVEVPSEIRRGAHWVDPDALAEVESRGRTGDGILRQPVWRGWRPDKG
ncbi:ATP-dependent DNA ligase [Arthrobacter woluwensis]|uniref:ATP-dependent DNA ligase n=1 Tax=Arthrobacter woluwensis TaxID=156980 RepID=UPI0038203A24